MIDFDLVPNQNLFKILYQYKPNLSYKLGKKLLNYNYYTKTIFAIMGNVKILKKNEQGFFIEVED